MESNYKIGCYTMMTLKNTILCIEKENRPNLTVVLSECWIRVIFIASFCLLVFSMMNIYYFYVKKIQ